MEAYSQQPERHHRTDQTKLQQGRLGKPDPDSTDIRHDFPNSGMLLQSAVDESANTLAALAWSSCWQPELLIVREGWGRYAMCLCVNENIRALAIQNSIKKIKLMRAKPTDIPLRNPQALLAAFLLLADERVSSKIVPVWVVWGQT